LELGDHSRNGDPLGELPVQALYRTFWTEYAVWPTFFHKQRKSPGFPEHS
jgi:hypothetical protein